MLIPTLLALLLAQVDPAATPPAVAPPLAAPEAAPAPEAPRIEPMAHAPRVPIGDVTTVKGMRTNELFGTGLIVGLNGTGDSARVTRRALANLLAKQNLNVTIQDLKDGNAALVMVTARLPAFAREGDRLDVSVAATGGATSLFGGTLLFTPLAGADATVYAIAQGPVTIGGFTASGQASSVSQNHPTVGLVTGGATIELDVASRVVFDGALEFRLHDPDFTTATRIAAAVNAAFPDSATTLDPGMVRVQLPLALSESEHMGFIAQISEIEIEPHVRARVVVNERTGTIIAGEGVLLGRAAIAHGNLTISVSESPQASQPAPFALGTTVTLPRTDLNATIDANGLSVLPATTTIGELAAALNALGATPRDLITILQALAKAGALRAELEVL